MDVAEILLLRRLVLSGTVLKVMSFFRNSTLAQKCGVKAGDLLGNDLGADTVVVLGAIGVRGPVCVAVLWGRVGDAGLTKDDRAHFRAWSACAYWS